MSTVAGRYEAIDQKRIIWGESAADAVAAEVEQRGAHRVFVIASRTVNTATPVVRNIAERLDANWAGVFDGCREHTPRETVIAAAEAVRATDADLIVSVGGGTVIDTAKVVLIALAENLRTSDALDDWHVSTDAQGNRTVPDVSPAPIRQIAVPTTLSGAEYSTLGGATDSKRRVKHGFHGSSICPESVILDPAASRYTPDWLWLSTGIRAVDHAVESVCSRQPNPLVDACALHGLALLGEALPACRANPDDLPARLRAMQGAWLASQGILRVDYGASHGIGHSLGAVTGMSHGYTSCVMLPAVLRWNAEKSSLCGRQAQVATALGASDGNAAAAVARLVESLDLPTSLREMSVERTQFDAVVEGALDNIWVRTNPRPISGRDDLRTILEHAY